VTGLRERYGRGVAIVGQDNLRRVVLRERDEPGAANIGLIAVTARYALEHGYHVIVEGILHADHYASMLLELSAAHPGESFFYYLDVPFAETLRRHATKPNAADFGAAEMASWYRHHDLLPDGVETVIDARSSLRESVTRIAAESVLSADPAAATSDLTGRAP
jgi:hypothetical protein